MPAQSKFQKPISKKPPLPPILEPTPGPIQRRLVLPSSIHPHQNKPTRTNYCRFLCFFLSTSLLILLTSLAVAAGLFYLWFTPRLPVFKLRPVQFTQFSINPGSDGTSRLQTGSSVWVEVKNPNSRLAVYYGESEMYITADGDVELGSASLPEFAQAIRNVTLLRFVVPAGSFQLQLDEETGKRLNATVKSGEVKFKVEVKTGVGFGLGKFRIRTVKLPVDVACGGVSLNKVRDDGPQKCRVNWFVW